MLLPVPSADHFKVSKPSQKGITKPAPAPVAPQSPTPSNARDEQHESHELQHAQTGKPAMGLDTPQAPAVAALHVAPLSQRIEAKKTNNHGAGRRWFGKWPVTVSGRAIGFGVGRSNDKPQTIGFPTPAPAAPRDKSSEMEASIAELRKRMDGPVEELSDINQRPGRPAWREKASKYWPISMFTAPPAGDLLSKNPVFGTAARARRKETVAMPPELSDKREQLLDHTARLRAGLEQAQLEYDTQMQLHAHDKDGSKHPDLQAAEADLLEKLAELRSSAWIGEHLDYYNNALATDLATKQVGFLKGEVDQLYQQLDQGELDDQQRFDVMRDQRTALNETVGLIGVIRQNAEIELLNIKELEQELKAERESLLDIPDMDPEELAQRDLDLKEVESLREIADQAASDWQKQEAAAATELEEFMHRYSAEVNLSLGGKLGDMAHEMNERAEAWKTRADAAWDDQKTLGQESLKALVQVPPGFETDALLGVDGAALRAALGKIAAKLKEDNPDAERDMPAQARLEILSRAVAQVCDGHGGRAAAVLEALASHPSEHWLPLPGEDRQADDPAADDPAADDENAITEVRRHPLNGPSDDLKKLFRSMASVPRGMEILNEAGADAAHPMLKRAPLDALHAYWMADAHQPESPALRRADSWLSKAQKMACYEVRNIPGETPQFDSNQLSDDVKIAYQGVSHGFLSNGPDSDYARVKASLDKVGKEWLEQTKDSKRTWAKAALVTTFNKNKSRATPFDPKAVGLTALQLEAQGIPSVKTLAHDGIAATARALSEKLATGWLEKEAPHMKDVRQLQTAARVLCDYIASHDDSKQELRSMEGSISRSKFHRSKRLYKSRLTEKDLQQMRRMAGPRNFVSGEPYGFPEQFNAIFRGDGATPQEALARLSDILKNGTYSKEVIDYLNDLKLDELREKTVAARRKQLDSADHVLTFFRPMLEELRLRNQLIMTAGAEVGVGIPLMGVTPVDAPMGLNMNLLSRKNEAQFQIKSPTYGVEFIIADVDTFAQDVKVSAGMGVEAGLFKATAPNASVKLEHSRSKTRFTTLRIMRDKDDDGVREEKRAREKSLGVLETLLRAKPGQPAAALDRILLEYPEVMIGWGDKKGSTLQGTTDFGAVLRTRVYAPIAPGGAPSVSVKLENAREESNEQSGYAHRNVHDRSDQRKVRVTATISSSVLGSVKRLLGSGEEGNHDSQGAWTVGSSLNAPEVSRDLWLHQEKNNVTHFSIGDKTGASIDRAYSSPEPLLAEIENNKEEFYLRFLDTLPAKKGEPKDTPERRVLAASRLNQFIEDLRTGSKNPSLQYNLKYEMQPRMSGWVDALRALETLATNGGDVKAADNYRRTLHDLVQQRSSWAYKNCAARSKGKSSADTGWDWALRFVARRSAETSVAVTAYPA